MKISHMTRNPGWAFPCCLWVGEMQTKTRHGVHGCFLASRGSSRFLQHWALGQREERRGCREEPRMDTNALPGRLPGKCFAAVPLAPEEPWVRQREANSEHSFACFGSRPFRAPLSSINESHQQGTMLGLAIKVCSNSKPEHAWPRPLCLFSFFQETLD